jgi:O-methyltransferase involved in polyketide biosynthesis
VDDYDFRRVSETALIPAFARGELTDIPYARQTLTFLRAKGVNFSDSLWSARATHAYAAFFEARFKAVNRILEEHGATQVLELAAGLSPRGMDFAQRGVIYVEADLADSTALKSEVVTAVLGQIPDNLRLCSASVLDRTEFNSCSSHFSAAPVAVTAEGLLRYLTFEEKAKLAANVHELLARHGGIWVTTDTHLRHWAMHRAPINREAETERLGRNLDPNYFDDLDHAQSFFESCGFVVEPRSLLEGIRDQVISLSDAPIDLAEELNDRQVFILHARDSR